MLKFHSEQGEISVSSAVFFQHCRHGCHQLLPVEGHGLPLHDGRSGPSAAAEAMSKGVNVIYNEDESISIELHIIVENGVNIPAVCRSIMNEVRYVVNKNTGAEVRAVDVFVDSMIL